MKGQIVKNQGERGRGERGVLILCNE